MKKILLTILSTLLLSLPISTLAQLSVPQGGSGLGSVVSGRILFGDTTFKLGTSSNLFWDKILNRLGIGTSTPQYTLEVVGDFGVDGSATTTGSHWMNYGSAIGNISSSWFAPEEFEGNGVFTGEKFVILNGFAPGNSIFGTKNLVGVRGSLGVVSNEEGDDFPNITFLDKDFGSNFALRAFSYNTGTDAFFIGNTGDTSALGINTTTPHDDYAFVAVGQGLFTGKLQTDGPFVAGSTNNIVAGDLEVNFAEGDFDFWVNGDNQSNLLYVDATTDRVGIGNTTTPHSLSKLAVNGNLWVEGNATTTGSTYLAIDESYWGSSDYSEGLKVETYNVAGSDFPMVVFNNQNALGISQDLGAFNNGFILSENVYGAGDLTIDSPIILFVSKDGVNSGTMVYVTTTDALVLDGFTGGLLLSDTPFGIDDLIVTNTALMGTTTASANFQTACDGIFQCFDNTSYTKGSFAANFRNQTFQASSTASLGGGSFLGFFDVIENAEGDFSSFNLDLNANVTNSRNDIYNANFNLNGTADYGSSHNGVAVYNIFAQTTANATSSWGVYVTNSVGGGTSTTTAIYAAATGAVNDNIAIETNGGDNIFRNTIFAPDAYNNSLTGTTRAAYLQDDGQLGYVVSSIEYKENIIDAPKSDYSWVSDVDVKEYNYKNQPDEKRVGLIAEQVAVINPNLVSYKMVPTTTCEIITRTENTRDGKGKVTETEKCTTSYIPTNVPETVNYNSPDFISGMLAQIQNTNETLAVKSSQRYKENIFELGNVDYLAALKVVNFQYKGNEEVQTGLIAEQVAKVDPSLVELNSENQPTSIKFSSLVSRMLKWTQDLAIRITGLENKVSELEQKANKVDDLEKRLKILENKLNNNSLQVQPLLYTPAPTRR